MESYINMPGVTWQNMIHTLRVTLQYGTYRGEFYKKVYWTLLGSQVLDFFGDFEEPTDFHDLPMNPCELKVKKALYGVHWWGQAIECEVFECVLTGTNEERYEIEGALLEHLKEFVVGIQIVHCEENPEEIPF